MTALDSPQLYRDITGNFIPVKRTINYAGTNQEIFLIPITISELKYYGSGLLSDTDIEFELLLNKVFKPKFVKDEFRFIKQDFVDLVVKDILFISGIDIEKKAKHIERDNEDDFGKSLRNFKLKKSENDMILFIHELGYSYFDYGKLTYKEINDLIEADNEKNKRTNSLLEASKNKRRR
jgi:hypothetical protein